MIVRYSQLCVAITVVNFRTLLSPQKEVPMP